MLYTGAAGVGSSPLTRGKPKPASETEPKWRLIPAHAGKTALSSTGSTPPTAHPRSRGENSKSRDIARDSRGSSPLTRGKPTRSPRRTKPGGLIPAHAGKTICNAAPPGTRPAHPRSRGENTRHRLARNRLAGSSPLTRGKPRQCAQARSACRLIPAHAGKTLIGGGDERIHWAHPRSRGENSAACMASADAGGSSPLTRGKPHSVQLVADREGLIPAHAGKTH